MGLAKMLKDKTGAGRPRQKDRVPETKGMSKEETSQLQADLDLCATAAKAAYKELRQDTKVNETTGFGHVIPYLEKREGLRGPRL